MPALSLTPGGREKGLSQIASLEQDVDIWPIIMAPSAALCSGPPTFCWIIAVDLWLGSLLLQLPLEYIFKSAVRGILWQCKLDHVTDPHSSRPTQASHPILSKRQSLQCPSYFSAPFPSSLCLEESLHGCSLCWEFSFPPRLQAFTQMMSFQWGLFHYKDAQLSLTLHYFFPNTYQHLTCCFYI